MILVNNREVIFKQFPNGETKMIESSIKHSFQIASFQEVSLKYENDTDLIKLMFVKNYLDTMFKYVRLTIYYMPYSRMDRSEGGSAFTLQYVTDFIKSLNFDSITVIEPHSDVTPALLGNRVKVVHMSEKILDLAKLEIGFDEEKDYIVYPDAGAQKRYSKSNPKNQLVGFKKRNFQTGRIESLEIIGDYGIRDYPQKAIIVDDLSSYGGTFLATAEKLKRYIDKVYLVVAHAEESIYKGEIPTSDLIDGVFTTDTILSKPTEDDMHKLAFGQKIKVYDIKELLYNNE